MPDDALVFQVQIRHANLATKSIQLQQGSHALAPGDDIDALVVFEDGLPGWTAGDLINFSLTPGSTSLMTGGIFAGGSGADIFGADGMGGIGPVAFAGSLGLLPTDDIDGLDFIPEPSSALLCALAGIVFLRRSRSGRPRAA